MTSQEFSIISTTIPTLPGIYKYFDETNTLLYVGKAKHLRKRISSYFSKTIATQKTHELVQRIHHIEFTIVNNEHDAFLLENTLIKEFQPKYNISLKDGKTYPYIVIKKEPFSRVFLTRRKINDGSQYYGPYTSVEKVSELLAFIKQHFLLRNCKLNLNEKNIQKNKFKVCLEYHLGNCKGPCQGLQTLDNYNNDLIQIKNILNGNLSSVIQHFKNEMKEYVTDLNFEKANISLKKIENLQSYQSKSTVVNTKIGTVDVFSILQDSNIAFVNYLAINNGAIINTKTICLENNLEESEETVLAFAIAQMRLAFSSKAAEIVIPFSLNYPEKDIIQTVPKAGDKKKLLELSEKNVSFFREDLKRKKMLHLEEKTENEKLVILHQLQKDLKLSALPLHIECFDNSNFQGSYPVSAMVCFINGEPSRADYRRYKVKTVVGINDFASMSEIVYRRYKRLKDENKTLPQLIIIDGGKGQLSAAMHSIKELQLPNTTTVVGLAKNEEEIFFPTDTESVKLAWDSASLKFIRRIRDEVHTHGITYHRNLRSKGTFVNELEQIKGIGETNASLLLSTFKSVKNIKLQSEIELAKIVGTAKAKLIFTYFKS